MWGWDVSSDEVKETAGASNSAPGKKPRLLLIAYRAFGDWLYSVPILPHLFERYEVYLETNLKVYQLVHDDPRFADISVFAYEKYAPETWPELFEKRWKACEEKWKPDRILNLNGTLEVTCVALQWQKEFTLPWEERRAHFGKRSFVDAVFERAEIPVPTDPKLDEVYFHPHEIDFVARWRVKHSQHFVVILPIAGSTAQKVFHNYLDVTTEILNRYPEAVVYMAGDAACGLLVPQHPRVFNMAGNNPIKQSILMTKYADMVIGPETSLLVAAGLWGTPKIMFCTTSSIYQCCKYHKNDYSMQAPLPCSPCHRAIYYENDCETMLGDTHNKVLYPACSKSFPTEELLQRVGTVYDQWKRRAVQPAIPG